MQFPHGGEPHKYLSIHYLLLYKYSLHYITTVCCLCIQQCLWEGEKVQDSVPIERWMVNAHSEMVWSRSLFVGSPADRGNCQPRPEPTEKPTQQSQDDSSTMPITQDEDYFGEDYESYYEQPSWPDGSRP